MKMYEIEQGILECVDLETGEILDEARLNELEMEKEKKIENVACWYKETLAQAEAIKAEKMELAKRQKVLENRAEGLKRWLSIICEGKKHEYARAVVSFRSTKAVNITDMQALIEFDDSLVKYADPTPDKDAIKKAIESGVKVAGAELVLNNSCSIK